MVAIGVDVSDISRVGGVAERRPRFLTKFFTEAERRYCAGRPERLAARWAAKEAVRKAFGDSGQPLPLYSQIAVGRRPGGAPMILVAGRPVPGLEVSLSHDGGVAVAVCTLTPPQGGPQGAVKPPPARLLLPERPEGAHKGTFGTVVVIAGSARFPGAAVLCSLGALRGGAGKVQVLVAADASSGTGLPPEVIQLAVRSATDGFDDESVSAVVKELEASSAVVCGPGLGVSMATAALLRSLFEWASGQQRALVLDADALNVCADNHHLLSSIPPGGVLTPHSLEAARLAGVDVTSIESDREGWAVRLAERLKSVVVLKGAGTVVAAGGEETWVDDHATPVLATGGSGDVLAGLIAALISQGLPGFAAAKAGVYLHGEAGMALGLRRGRAGVLASEIADELVEVQEATRRQLPKA